MTDSQVLEILNTPAIALLGTLIVEFVWAWFIFRKNYRRVK